MGVLQKAMDGGLSQVLAGDQVQRAVFSRILKSKGLKLTSKRMDRFMLGLTEIEQGRPFPDNLFPELEGDNEITDADVEKAQAEVVDAFQIRHHAVLKKLLGSEPKKLVRLAKRDSRGPLSDRLSERLRFEKSLERHWGKGFNAMEMFIGCIRELAGQSLEDWSEMEAASPSTPDGLQLTLVLRDLHMKACRIASEILCLLRSGYCKRSA